MQNIFLHKPVILAASLEDMQPKHQAIALDLLHHRKFLTYTETGIQFLTAKEAGDTDMIFHEGSEAVCIYRQALGLPDHSIRVIKVHEIINQVSDYDTLKDIVSLLSWVDSCNDTLRNLSNINPPRMILWSASDRLQEAVEMLQDNAAAREPFKKCVHDFDPEGDTCSCHSEIRKSLKDIDYYLQIITGMPELPDEDEDDDDCED